MSKLFKRNILSKLHFWQLITFVKNTKQVAYFHSTKSLLRSLSTVDPHKSVYLLDDTDSDDSNKSSNINKFTTRTHTCGELKRNNIGEEVVLCGWLEYQRMNKFAVLRDSYGEIQLLIPEEKMLQQVPYETIIQIKGTVVPRPKDMINHKQKTGEIEVQVDYFEVLNRAKDQLPFNLREFQKAKEPLRMQYRYLDIRFPQMQKNLRVRSKLLMKMREFLIDNHFVDVETPTLFKATPGGAQEFIVPTRFPGKFYSLVQSPQQFKQMLMAGALDRYFQIAKCYRDEGARPDRQPEFTQLDIELSFTSLEGVIKLIEELLFYALSEFYDGIPHRFIKMSYEEAMDSYGSDQPNITFGYKLKNCTEIFNDNATQDFGAYLLVFDPESLQNAGTLTKSFKEKMAKLASQYPKAKLIQSKEENWAGKLYKIFSTQEADEVLQKFSISPDSVVFMAYGSRSDARNLLGKIRLEYVQYLEQNFHLSIKQKGLHFLWVVDFPLFELDGDNGALQSVHHPFTAPHPDDLDLLEENPLKVRSLAYDLVLNGNEIGGGSIRIHNPALQEKILNLLNINKSNLQHIIEMLGSGCPPHGGIALGVDRLLALLLNMNSIRDVIAFPKTFEGKDPISQAPAEVSDDILQLYHIKPITAYVNLKKQIIEILKDFYHHFLNLMSKELKVDPYNIVS